MFIQGGKEGNIFFGDDGGALQPGGLVGRGHTVGDRFDVVRTGRVAPVCFLPPGLGDGGGKGESGCGFWVECHCGAPTAAGTGVLRALVAADRTGEPVRGPRAVEAGKAEIPEGGRGRR